LLVVTQIKKMDDLCLALNVALWLAIVVKISKAESSLSCILIGETQELLCEMRPHSSDYENYCLVICCIMQCIIKTKAVHFLKVVIFYQTA
jgi:hypothetical protein